MLCRAAREAGLRASAFLAEVPRAALSSASLSQLYSERLASPSAASGPTPDTRTICVVHGLLGVGRNLGTLTRKILAAAESSTGHPWQAVLLDQRCHGKSGHLGLPGPHTLAASAEDILRLFDSLDYAQRPHVLIGHSLGGKVCLELTEQMASEGHAPSQTWVLDAWPLEADMRSGGLADTLNVLESVANIHLPLPSRAALYDELGRRGFSVGMQQWLGSNLYQREKGRWEWTFDLSGASDMIDDYCQQDYLPLLTNPPLGTTIHIVRALNSDRWSEGGVAQLKDLTRAPASAQRGAVLYHELPNAGHWVHVDNPTGLLDLIVPSLKNVI